MADETISVRSVTGVDMTMTIAGPGSRSYAFIIDWHIRILVAGAWLLAMYLLGFKTFGSSRGALITSLPATAIYLLYHPVLEIALRGRTPGKRIAGARLVDRNGGTPSTMALFIRNAFRLIDSLPLGYAIGLVSCFVTRQRVRIGDMAAGTLLVIDASQSESTLLRLEGAAGKSHLPLETVELIDQVLERWDSLEAETRVRIARTLLGRIDPQFPASDDHDPQSLRGRLQALIEGTPDHAGTLQQ